MTSKAVLAVVSLCNPEAPITEIHTDASSKRLAGMFCKAQQKDLTPCILVSKKTTPAEQQYHSSRLELMGIVWTLEHL